MSYSQAVTPAAGPSHPPSSAFSASDRESLLSEFRYPAASELGSPEADVPPFVDSVSGRLRSRITVPAPWIVCCQFTVMAAAIEVLSVLSMIAGQERMVAAHSRFAFQKFVVVFAMSRDHSRRVGQIQSFCTDIFPTTCCRSTAVTVLGPSTLDVFLPRGCLLRVSGCRPVADFLRRQDLIRLHWADPRLNSLSGSAANSTWAEWFFQHFRVAVGLRWFRIRQASWSIIVHWGE